MDWDDIRVFLTVAREGAISAAARALDLSRAAVWRRVQALEAATGAQLFDRHPFGYVLSQSGVALRRNLEPMPEKIAAAVRSVRERPTTVCGDVRVSAPAVVGEVFAERARQLRDRHPKLRLELDFRAPAHKSAAGFDILVSLEPGCFAGFVGEGSARIPFGLYASPAYAARRGHAAGPSDLGGHALIDFETANSHIAPPSLSLARQTKAEVVLRSNSPVARRAAARAGLGVIMEPVIVGDGDRGLVRMSSSAEVGAITVWLHLASSRRQERPVLVVRDWVVECLASFSSGAPANLVRTGA